ncbi:MAG: type I secretion C-terminal target domain-containing protein, partial [Oceanospirillaceae bacterium]|nr:type I secretion C-terminal target domain-containing protein [Oceanospirillaceae bacterium]
DLDTITLGEAGTITQDFTVTVTDDVPLLDVTSISLVESESTKSGVVTFNDGADAIVAFDSSVSSLSLDNASELGVQFEISDESTNTYRAYYDNNGSEATAFTISINTDGTYDFNLVDGLPPRSFESGELFGSIGNPVNLDSRANDYEQYSIGKSAFGGAFDVVITGRNGTDEFGTAKISKSATDIGVESNTVTEDQAIRFDISRQTGYETVGLTSFTIVASSTAGLADGEIVIFDINFSDGTNTYSDPVEVVVSNSDIGTDGNFHITLTLESLEYLDGWYLDSIDVHPKDVSNGTDNMKIVGLSLGYEAPASTDTVMEFTLSGDDTDGDMATAAFTVEMLSGSDGADVVYGTSSDDQVTSLGGDDQIYTDGGNDLIMSGAGNDIIYGGSGDDTMSGGTGLDTFAWNVIDTDTGMDIITDYSVSEGDILDFSDLLLDQSEVSLTDTVDGLLVHVDNGTESQDVVLQSVTKASLVTDLSLTGTPSDADIIQALVGQNNLDLS